MKNRNRSKYSFANINLLGKCNLDCFFCLGKDLATEFSKYNQLNVKPKNLKNIIKFLHLCKKKGIEKIYLTGQNTDPLIYRHLEKLIDWLQNEWSFKVGIRTNSLLAEKKIETINKCQEEISYTLLSLDKDVAKSITGNATIPNFDYLLKKTKSPLRVATVFTKQNKDEILQLIKFVSNYDKVRYFQLRKISTDTRYYQLKEHLKLYEKFVKEIKRDFSKIDEFEKAEIYDIYGVPVSLWRTVETSANSLNYFSNGVISENYFIIEGYLSSTQKKGR